MARLLAVSVTAYHKPERTSLGVLTALIPMQENADSSVLLPTRHSLRVRTCLSALSRYRREEKKEEGRRRGRHFRQRRCQTRTSSSFQAPYLLSCRYPGPSCHRQEPYSHGFSQTPSYYHVFPRTSTTETLRSISRGCSVAMYMITVDLTKF